MILWIKCPLNIQYYFYFINVFKTLKFLYSLSVLFQQWNVSTSTNPNLSNVKVRAVCPCFSSNKFNFAGMKPWHGIYVGMFIIRDKSDVYRGFCTKIRAWLMNKSILHIYFYQTEKHICKNFENMWQVKIFYIYIFFNQQNIYVKSVWNLWQMNIYYISITKNKN